MNFFRRTYYAWKEILNFFYIGRIIKKNQNSEGWKKFNLRHGYANQIFTVINLRKEDMGEEDTIKRMRVIERIEPLNRYIENLNLSEIVRVEINKIEDSRSYLIIYWPLWNHFSIWRLLFWTLILFITGKLIFKYNIHNLILDVINQIIFYLQ